jgi:hypothetical protein
MSEWTPRSGGRLLELGSILEPLAPFADRLTVVSGLENTHAYGPVHAITPGTWLSCASPRAAGSPRHGITVDQLAAEHLGRDTPLPSLELAAEPALPISAGAWAGEYAESFGSTLSFRGSSDPLPMESDPRRVFDRLFGAGTSVDARAAGSPRPASVLDLVADDAAAVRRRLGPADRAVLATYLDAVRGVERRVALSGGEETHADRVALQFDLLALAFQADITRVATFMMAAETSRVTYGHLGVAEPFHLVSHHQNEPAKIDSLVRIQRHHTELFARFVRRLAEVGDGDGTLLDRSILLYGSNMSDSHRHDHFPLPAAVVGGGEGALRGGQHVVYPDRTPLANLHVTLLQRAGVPVETFDPFIAYTEATRP